VSDFAKACELVREIEACLADESSEGPWEHLGDASRDIATLLAGLREAERALAEYEAAAMATTTKVPMHLLSLVAPLHSSVMTVPREIGRAALERVVAP
jgi:hypothetical protein